MGSADWWARRRLCVPLFSALSDPARYIGYKSMARALSAAAVSRRLQPGDEWETGRPPTPPSDTRHRPDAHRERYSPAGGPHPLTPASRSAVSVNICGIRTIAQPRPKWPAPEVL